MPRTKNTCSPTPAPTLSTATSGLPEQLDHFERAVITEELRRHNGDVAATAKALKLPKPTLYDKLRSLRLATDDFRNAGATYTGR